MLMVRMVERETEHARCAYVKEKLKSEFVMDRKLPFQVGTTR